VFIVCTAISNKTNATIKNYFGFVIIMLPLPVAARSKACVCSRSLVGLRVGIPGTWMSVSRECFVLSGKGICVGLITRPKEFY
jgi:hypothetical protein